MSALCHDFAHFLSVNRWCTGPFVSFVIPQCEQSEQGGTCGPRHAPANAEASNPPGCNSEWLSTPNRLTPELGPCQTSLPAQFAPATNSVDWRGLPISQEASPCPLLFI